MREHEKWVFLAFIRLGDDTGERRIDDASLIINDAGLLGVGDGQNSNSPSIPSSCGNGSVILAVPIARDGGGTMASGCWV